MRLRVLISSLLTAMILAPAAAKADGVAELPRWRIQVRAYGPEQSSFVAIHHRITAQSELGLQLDGSISNSNTDLGEHYEDAADYSRFAISLRPEYRRWFIRENRVSIFWGWNVLVGYRTSASDQKRIDPSYESHADLEGLSLGAGFSMGADLALLDHLGITMLVTPVSFEHAWTNTTETRGYSGEMGTTRAQDRVLTADLLLTPALYACIRF